MKFLFSLLTIFAVSTSFASQANTFLKASFNKPGVEVSKEFLKSLNSNRVDAATLTLAETKDGNIACTLELLKEACPPGKVCVRGGLDPVVVYVVMLDPAPAERTRFAYVTSEQEAKRVGYSISVDSWVTGKVDVYVQLGNNKKAKLKLVGAEESEQE